MKKIIIILSLITLASCGAKSSSSSSKKCSLNESPFDCSEMNSESASNSTSLTAQVSSKIMFFNDFIEIKERTSNVKRELINGKVQACEVSTNDLVGFFFHLDENSLYLRIKDLGESVIYKKINGKSDSIYGSWENTIKENNHLRQTTLVISEGNIQIVAKCIYK